jgi:hypothetical protein
MELLLKRLNYRQQNARIQVHGENFDCVMETDWKSDYKGAYIKAPCFDGISLPHLRFGFAGPWNWLLDLKVFETEAGILVKSQGYEKLTGRRIPFMRNRTYFWSGPEMIYEVAEVKHLPRKEYLIAGINPDRIVIDPLLRNILYPQDGVTICWQFSPLPVYAERNWDTGDWLFEFESNRVETLIQWSTEESPSFYKFTSISEGTQRIHTTGPRGERFYQAGEKNQCVEPDESLLLPEGEFLITGVESRDGLKASLKNGLWDMSVRQFVNDEVYIGEARIFSLGKLMETKKFPIFKPYLVRALRSLMERIAFNVVTEDDPDQYYLWGTGTWPRCFSILCLDYFGFHEEAYGYLEFMLDISHQFDDFDGVPHLWDSFFITGNYRGDTLYDINGHSIKLYEAGKFYLNHRGDGYGKKLRDEHYETLKGWCTWIERHMSEEGLVLDITESNVWNRGYGTFTQAPAAAGIRLFINIASDMGNKEDVEHFNGIVAKLMSGLENYLYGKGGNPHFNIPDEIGNCFITYVPYKEIPDTRGNRPKGIGLSCYSLAANYFLQDPDVGLLRAEDPKASETLRLALEYLGDPFDPRIIRWHLSKPHPSHLGYGQGQLLMSLIYGGKSEEFQIRLEGLFDVSRRETGDIYLMQEVLARSGSPNRGNKAHLTYFPVMAAYLADLAIKNGDAVNKLLPGLTIIPAGR